MVIPTVTYSYAIKNTVSLMVVLYKLVQRIYGSIPVQTFLSDEMSQPVIVKRSVPIIAQMYVCVNWQPLAKAVYQFSPTQLSVTIGTPLLTARLRHLVQR